jgi:hypothetical protein
MGTSDKQDESKIKLERIRACFQKNLKWDIVLMRLFTWPTMVLLVGLAFALGGLACIAVWHSIPDWEHFGQLDERVKLLRLLVLGGSSLLGFVTVKLVGAINQQTSLLMYHETKFTYYFTLLDSPGDISGLKQLAEAYYRDATHGPPPAQRHGAGPPAGGA